MLYDLKRARFAGFTEEWNVMNRCKRRCDYGICNNSLIGQEKNQQQQQQWQQQQHHHDFLESKESLSSSERQARKKSARPLKGPIGVKRSQAYFSFKFGFNVAVLKNVCLWNLTTIALLRCEIIFWIFLQWLCDKFSKFIPKTISV